MLTSGTRFVNNLCLFFRVMIYFSWFVVKNGLTALEIAQVRPRVGTQREHTGEEESSTSRHVSLSVEHVVYSTVAPLGNLKVVCSDHASIITLCCIFVKSGQIFVAILQK